MGSFALCDVVDGWTGTVSVTYDSVTAVVTPHPRDSIAAVFARVAQAALVELGLELRLSADPDAYDDGPGSLTVSADEVFAMAVTGNALTLTGFYAGTYSGAATYTSSVRDEWWIPARGGRLEDVPLVADGGLALNSTMAAVAPTRSPASLHVTAWHGSGSGGVGAPPQGVCDVFHDGRIFARGLFDDAEVTPLGRQRSFGQVRYSLTGREVT